jgi:glutamate racemase
MHALSSPQEDAKKVAGPGISLIDSAEETARAVSETLERSGERRISNPRPRREFYVTDSPERFRKLGQIFLNQPLEDVHHVEL